MERLGYIVDLYDNYMKYGEIVSETELKDNDGIAPFKLPKDEGCLAAIQRVEMNKTIYQTYDSLEVNVTYDIFDSNMKDLQLGVAIHSRDRKNYIFGPNTNLDKKSFPGNRQICCAVSDSKPDSAERGLCY